MIDKKKLQSLQAMQPGKNRKRAEEPVNAEQTAAEQIKAEQINFPQGTPMSQVTDPQKTLEVKNEAVEEQLKAYKAEHTADRLNALIFAMRSSRVLLAAGLNQDKQPIPSLVKASTGEMMLPIFTAKEQIPEKARPRVIMNMPFLQVVEIAVKMAEKETDPFMGIVINPFTDNLTFKMALLQKIQETEAKFRNMEAQRQAAGQAAGASKAARKTVELTPRQYAAFEHMQFEMTHLPRHLFTEGEAFVEELCEKREEYVDSLFEASYQQPRMYPYLPEEFGVMVMNLTDDLTIVRVDFPTRDQVKGCCPRSYLTWSKKEGKGRYFAIANLDQQATLIEIRENLGRNSLGPAPVEGAELQKIVDLVSQEQ